MLYPVKFYGIKMCVKMSNFDIIGNTKSAIYKYISSDVIRELMLKITWCGSETMGATYIAYLSCCWNI